MELSLQVVSIKVISFMKIKRKGFVMKGGETCSPPGQVSRVNASRRLLAAHFLSPLVLEQPHQVKQSEAF